MNHIKTVTSQELKRRVLAFYNIFFVDMRLVWKHLRLSLVYGLFCCNEDLEDRHQKIAEKALRRMKRRADRRIETHLAQQVS